MKTLLTLFLLTIFPMFTFAENCGRLADKIKTIRDVKIAINCVASENLILSSKNKRLRDEMVQLRSNVTSTNNRIDGIRLNVVGTSDSGNWACGETQTAGRSELVFMYGSRDGTGCGIRNVNYYKEIGIHVPAGQ
jgi:hypothetical protein